MDRLFVFLIAAAPVFELRGAIPFGVARGLPLGQAVALSVVGNILVIVPLLFLFRWLLAELGHIVWFKRILQWWFARVEKKSVIVRRYGFWGLVFLVAIPLPGTGAWTGSAVATLLEFELKRAVAAIVIGVIIAAGLITLGSLGVIKAWAG